MGQCADLVTHRADSSEKLVRIQREHQYNQIWLVNNGIMPDQKTKDKLKELCDQVVKGEKTEEDLIKFFHLNREAVFDNALPYSANALYANVLTNMTCSCGSRTDSCNEDGPGKFSTFFFTEEGMVFRRIEQK